MKEPQNPEPKNVRKAEKLVLPGPWDLVGRVHFRRVRETQTMGLPHPSELTKPSGELLWSQKAIAISIQGIKYILQVLQAEGQFFMEPLKTTQTALVSIHDRGGWPGTSHRGPVLQKPE